MKKVKILLAAVLMLCLLVPGVRAFGAEKGSLEVVKISSGVCLHYVAGPLGEPVGDFIGAGITDLGESTKAAENAGKLYEYAIANGIAGTVKEPGEGGNVVFEDLATGIYLVYSTAEKAEFTPFLVSVPTVINGEYIYDIEAQPKENLPDEPNPEEPVRPGTPDIDDEIPQTGSIVWPKYFLMALGTCTVLAGLVEMVLGREKEI